MNRLERLTKGKHSEPAKVAQEKLLVVKGNLKRKKDELEELGRKRKEESLKIETINQRLEYFDNQIELTKKEIEDMLYKIKEGERTNRRK